MRPYENRTWHRAPLHVRPVIHEEAHLSLRQSACHMSAVRIMRRKALTSAALLDCLLSCQPFL